ncbi:hypothetical protein VYA_16060 [Vibrio alfacsensis]|nr:hypothetical protein VYA_16060 [Vibrio alfacsensis]
MSAFFVSRIFFFVTRVFRLPIGFFAFHFIENNQFVTQRGKVAQYYGVVLLKTGCTRRSKAEHQMRLGISQIAHFKEKIQGKALEE